MSSILLALLLAAPQQNGYGDQEPVRPGGAPGFPSTWSFEGRAGVGFRYDSNVWLLDGGQQDALEADLPANQTSGRFDDMESVDDFIFTPELRLGAGGPSPLGRRLTAYFDLGYPVYAQNSRRNHLDLEFGVVQAIGARGRLELSFGFVPEYFQKNYLADAVDVNGDGDISSGERIYQDGTYREFELELEYRHKLIQRSSQKPFGMDGTIASGWRDRTYDSPFHGWDQSVPFARVGLGFAYGPKIKGGIHYEFEAIDTPTDPEVVLIDEVALGQDVNGDTLITDSARTVTSVDRTRNGHSIGVSLGYEVTPTIEGEIGYERSLGDWQSDEPLDFSHNGRKDSSDTVEVVLKIQIWEGWDGRVGYAWRNQNSDRDDPGASGETVGYKRNLVFASAIYRW